MCEQAKVFVNSACLGVIVSRSDVGVIGEFAVLLPSHHLRQFAVCLQPDKPVHNVNARFLELPRPRNVVLFVKASFHLDERKDRLSGLRRCDERPHDRGITRCAVQRLLDGEDLRVRCGLLNEGLHTRRERFVWMMDENLALAHGREQVGVCVRLRWLERGNGGGNVFVVLELRSGDTRNLEHLIESENPGQPIDFTGVHSQFSSQETERDVIHFVGDFKPNRCTESSARESRFEGLDQVFALVFVELKVFVARHAEDVMVENLHPGKQ